MVTVEELLILKMGFYWSNKSPFSLNIVKIKPINMKKYEQLENQIKELQAEVERLKFEYANTWNCPRFFNNKSVSNAVGTLSLAHGLDLETFHEQKTLFSSIGGFKVIGEFPDVRKFGEALERQYGEYLSDANTDWDFYQNSFEGNY
jgi:hypothetical protein